jgi:DNA-directed RNA polymerase subunit H (RpoH/RPB5)
VPQVVQNAPVAIAAPQFVQKVVDILIPSKTAIWPLVYRFVD